MSRSKAITKWRSVERERLLTELREIPLPPHATVVRVPEGFTITLSPQFARTLVVLDELFPGIRCVRRTLLRAQEAI